MYCIVLHVIEGIIIRIIKGEYGKNIILMKNYNIWNSKIRESTCSLTDNALRMSSWSNLRETRPKDQRDKLSKIPFDFY